MTVAMNNSVHHATRGDIARIAEADLNGDSFFQSPAWARVKSRFGWEAFSFRQSRYAGLQRDVLVLLKKIPPLGYIAYAHDALLPLELSTNPNYEVAAPEAPHETSHKVLLGCAADVLFDIATILAREEKKNIFALRYDAPWVVPAEHATKQSPIRIAGKGVMGAGPFVQPPATVLLDLSLSEEELLAAMKSKTRYNIRLAAKQGVSVADGVSMDDFYALYQTTSKRNGIAIHSLEYYRAVEEAAQETSQLEPNAEVYMYGARYQGELIASAVVVHYRPNGGQKRALYLYGASSNEHRSLMPAYALQWHAITEAKKLGCVSYDLFGIPNIAAQEKKQQKDQQKKAKVSSMAGLIQFKIGFGGAVYSRAGGFSCVPRGFFPRAANAAFCCAEFARAALMKCAKYKKWFGLRRRSVRQ